MNQIVKALKEQEAYAVGNGLWKLEQLYKMAALEIETKAAHIARLTADAKLNDMAWNDNQAALNKQAKQIEAQAAEIRRLRGVIISYQAGQQ